MDTAAKPASVAKSGGEKQEVLINGTLYDVTNFRHPGGRVLGFYAGKDIDATQAFDQFHVRSKKVENFMKSLPNRPAADPKKTYGKLPGQADLVEDFQRLILELKKEGYYEPSPMHVVYRVVEIFAMHALGFYLLLKGSNYGIQALGLAILGIVSGRCGWLMHEGGHYSLTGYIAIDRFLQIFLYGVGCGMSGSWWRSQHNRHHAMPQKIDHDVDLDTLPLVAFTINKVGPHIGLTMKTWLRLQGYLFPIVTCELVALGWQLFLHPRHVLRNKNYGEGIFMIARYVGWHYLVTNTFGLGASAALYLAYNWVASTYIFTNFAVSHTHLPTVAKEDTTIDWIRYAANYTMNVSPGPFNFVNWWMSYLNFQIEHHLFPSMPQYRFPKLSPRIREFFAKHNLVYDQRNYFESMYDTFKNLDKVGSDVFLG